MRVRTLWRVPVFCLLASMLSYWLTVFAGPLFYVNRVANADGSIKVSVDPLRSTLLQIALFLLVLLLGGLWAFPFHDAAGDRLFGGAADPAHAGHRSGAALGPRLPAESQRLLVSVLQLERQPFLPLDAVLPPPARRDHHRPVRAFAVRPLWAAKGLTSFL